ncbi:uncharacterized protein LOC131006973 [Salvia miltiorrhiza]|uniref:uncharacterized protein LOC131006973 n=1 Tax=Salvia miltiorrhiza TaxID=226208 RepID=UPI0025ABEF59|nr:uncharacterized protein LOC131006973 [Salvia miltiorrhiza]
MCRVLKYYTFCVDTKKEKVYALDSQNELVDICQAAKYGTATDLVKNMLADYLAYKGHVHKSNVVKRSKLAIVHIKWGDAKNINDMGVYMMRHMETFMGDSSSLWTCGLAPKLRKQLNLLRVRYCAALIAWERNSIRDAMEESAKLSLGSSFDDPNLNIDVTLLGK